MYVQSTATSSTSLYPSAQRSIFSSATAPPTSEASLKTWAFRSVCGSFCASITRVYLPRPSAFCAAFDQCTVQS